MQRITSLPFVARRLSWGSASALPLGFCPALCVPAYYDQNLCAN